MTMSNVCIIIAKLHDPHSNATAVHYVDSLGSWGACE